MARRGVGVFTQLWNYMLVYSGVQGSNSQQGAGAHVLLACWGHLVSKFQSQLYCITTDVANA